MAPGFAGEEDDRIITVHQGNKFLFKHSCLPPAKILIHNLTGLNLGFVPVLDKTQHVGEEFGGP